MLVHGAASMVEEITMLANTERRFAADNTFGWPDGSFIAMSLSNCGTVHGGVMH